MKTSSRFFTLASALIILFSGTLQAQTSKEIKAKKKAAFQTALKNAIENRQFNFLEYNPVAKDESGNSHTSPYILELQGDKLDTDLPYFSLAYNTNEPTIQKRVRLNTTDFNYLIKPGKKDGWEVKITARDQTNPARILLRISSDGYATANVHGQYQENVNYYGTVAAND